MEEALFELGVNWTREKSVIESHFDDCFRKEVVVTGDERFVRFLKPLGDLNFSESRKLGRIVESVCELDFRSLEGSDEIV